MRLGESKKKQGIFLAYGKTFRQPVNRYIEVDKRAVSCLHLV